MKPVNNKPTIRLSYIIYVLLFLLAGNTRTQAADYYWVGGTGNWSDYANHWATSSGGVIFHATLPGPVDNVYFDANSFTADSQYVFVDSTFAYCHDMDWTGVQYKVRLQMQGWPSNQINLYGSLILSSNIYALFCSFNFAGTGTTIDINTNGVYIQGNLVFTGSGSRTLSDSLSCYWLDIQNGPFSSDGHLIRCTRFITSSVLYPDVDISNSTVYASSINIGANPNFNGSQSRVIISGGTTSTSTITCNNQTFGTIIFDCDYGKLYGKITADTVIFTGPGYVGSTQQPPGSLTCNFLLFNSAANLITSPGQTSIIKYAEFLSDINYSGNTTFDTLNWNNPGGNIIMSGTITVNDTLIANNSCTNVTTFIGNNVGNIICYAAMVQLEYIRLGGIQASGGAVFIANNSFDLGNNTGWQITTPATRNVYWVNGGGNWTDPNHWSIISGGPGGACPPNEMDNVFFDPQSFSQPNDTIVIGSQNIYINDFNFMGVTGNPFIHNPGSAGYTFVLNLNGSLEADAVADIRGTVKMISSNSGNTIKSGPLLLQYEFDGNGEWTLADNFQAKSVFFRKGIFNSNSFEMDVDLIYSYSGISPATLNLGTSDILAKNINWSLIPNSAINAQNTNIIFKPSISSVRFYTNGNSLNYINFKGNGAIQGDFSCNKLVFDSTYSIVSNSASMQSLEINSDGFMDGDFDLDSLIQNAPGALMQFAGNTNLNITTFLEVSGSTCNERSELIGNGPVNLYVPSGSVDLDFVILRNINAGGGAVFNAFNAIDAGGNSGWNLTSPQARTLYWVGGTGNWSDQNHWSLSSGGTGGNCIPTAFDDVVIDTNSFVLPTYEIINIDQGNIYLKNLHFSSQSLLDYINIDDNEFINVYGSLLFSAKANFGGNFTSSRASFKLRGTGSGQIIRTSQTDLEKVILESTGIYALDDSLNCEMITFRNGSFTTDNHPINSISIRVENDSSLIDLGNSFIYTDTLDVRFAGSGFNGQNASLKFNQGLGMNPMNYFYAENQKFKYVESGKDMRLQGGFQADEAVFVRDFNQVNTSLNLNIGKCIVYEDFTFSSSGEITFDTLILNNEGYTFQMQSGTTLRINNYIEVNNSPSFPNELISSNNGIFNFEKPAGLVCMDNMIMRGVQAVGNGIFYAGANTIDLGNNSGWIYASCNPANSDVWPGDANYDLTVDNFDVLYLGLAYGATGPARAGASNTWVAQPASDWQFQFANGANLKNADSDGNGVVANADTIAISQNYGLTHPMRVPNPTVSSLPPIQLYLEATPDTVMLGDTVHIDVLLGTTSVPVDSIYGIAFTISFDSTLIDTTYMEFNYSAGWMGTQGTNLLTFEKKFLAQGYADVAITRTDYQNAAGSGIIVSTGVVVIDNIGARLGSSPPYVNFPITLSNPRALTAAEYYLAIALSGDGVEIDTSQTVSLNEVTMLAEGITVYPNPAKDHIKIVSNKHHLTGIEVFDMMGVSHLAAEARGNSYQLSLSDLADGLYSIRIRTAGGMLHRKIVVRQ